MRHGWWLALVAAGCSFQVEGFELDGAVEDLAVALDFAMPDLAPQDGPIDLAPEDAPPPDLEVADLRPTLNGFPSHVSGARLMPGAADLTGVTQIRTNDPIGVELNGAGGFVVPAGTTFAVEGGF